MSQSFKFISRLLKKEYFILFLILALFLITRLYKIGEVPSSVYWDEASIGYNAFSIVQTGRDEWGETFPLHFKAFGEYKLPVYIYSVALPVKLFGLHEWTVRLPAVVFSIFSILLTFLIAKTISGQTFVGLLSAFSLSITPYMFIFSRTGYEATAGLTFFLLGVWIFLRSRQNLWLLLLSVLSLVISMYAYNSYRIIAPLAMLIFILRLLGDYRKQPVKISLAVAASLIIFLTGCYPIAQFLSSADATSRFQAVGIDYVNRKKIFIGLDVVGNYLSHFNPNFLFLNGDQNARSQQPGFGELIIFDAVLLLLGLFYLRKEPSGWRWPVLFALLGFIPAALTREVPHALRSLSAAPFLIIISSYGVVFLRERFAESKKLILWAVVIGYLGMFAVYFNNFLCVYSVNSGKDWQEEYKLAFQTYAPDFAKYDHIQMSDRYSEPYIFALYYLSFNPDTFRRTVVYNTGKISATSVVKSFDKFIFDTIDYHHLPEGKTLIFAHPTDRLNELPVKNILYRRDGSVAFYVYEYDNFR